MISQGDKAVAGEAKRVSFDSIPVVDIGPLSGGDRRAMERVAAALDHACRNIGFFYIKNHGVPQAVIERVCAEAARFFALPLDDKMKIYFRKARHYGRGYVPLLENKPDPTMAKADLHEAFELSLELPADDPDYLAGCKMYGPNQWPEDLPGFRAGIYAYYEAIRELGRTLFRAFAIALDLPDDYFEDKIDKPMGQLRVIRYPPQEGPIDGEQWGIGAHADYECFTILWQDEVGGLEVVNSAGDWIEAPPIPGTFVVNIGDMLARWTNDIYASTVHRVLNRSGQERYSFPFFYGANYDTVVTCLESCRDEGQPPKYPPTSAGEWAVVNIRQAYNFSQ